MNIARCISVETLRHKAMMRGRHSFSVADAGLGELYRQIRYKAEWAGRGYRALDPFARSTGCCPDCGTVGERLDLSVRRCTCVACGTVHERDYAAARWIDLVSKGQIKPLANTLKVGRRTPEPPRALAPVAKRGSAGNGKPRPSGRRARPGHLRMSPPERTAIPYVRQGDNSLM